MEEETSNIDRHCKRNLPNLFFDLAEPMDRMPVLQPLRSLASCQKSGMEGFLPSSSLGAGGAKLEAFRLLRSLSSPWLT